MIRVVPKGPGALVPGQHRQAVHPPGRGHGDGMVPVGDLDDGIVPQHEGIPRGPPGP